jgi:hypothetical protein|uniref:Rod shape-determining protein MreD n=1 Tax=Desulfurella acetivorans TaxID=33002 RepID=A0A832AWU7_DESAE
MKYLIFALILLIATAFSVFSSYMFFIPYEAFSFVIIAIIAIANNTYPNSNSPSKFYFAAFLAGFLLDCMQETVFFYNALVFVVIVFLNDLSKNIFGSKFIFALLLLIGIYDNLILKVPFFVSLLNVLLLYFFYSIVQSLLKINYAKKD